MGRTAFYRGLLLMAWCLLAGIAGCDVQSSEPSANSDSNPSVQGPKIVSLTPAITQMLIDMGKRDHIIGVSKEDDASLGLPVCGSFNGPDVERILKLSPDIVLTETPTGRYEQANEGLRDQASRGAFELKAIPHSRSIADVHRALVDPDNGLGAALGDPSAAQQARDLMQQRLDRISAVVRDAPRPRVLILINPMSLGAIGTGVTHDEMLSLAGGTNALAHVSSGYLTLDRTQLEQRIRPDIVIILEPGGSELQDGDARLRGLEGLTIPAVMNRRFSVIQHRQAMLPSTALPKVMLEIAQVLHPDKAAELREAYESAEADLKPATIKEDGS